MKNRHVESKEEDITLVLEMGGWEVSYQKQILKFFIAFQSNQMICSNKGTRDFRFLNRIREVHR